MTEIARWLTLTAAAALIGGTVYEVEVLADCGVLTVRSLDLCHRSVSEESVNAYLSASEPTTPSGEALAEHADTPLTPRDPDNPAEHELTHADNRDYEKEREQ